MSSQTIFLFQKKDINIYIWWFCIPDNVALCGSEASKKRRCVTKKSVWARCGRWFSVWKWIRCLNISIGLGYLYNLCLFCAQPSKTSFLLRSKDSLILKIRRQEFSFARFFSPSWDLSKWDFVLLTNLATVYPFLSEPIWKYIHIHTFTVRASPVRESESFIIFADHERFSSQTFFPIFMNDKSNAGRYFKIPPYRLAHQHYSV